jgi:hypothetical protein
MLQNQVRLLWLLIGCVSTDSASCVTQKCQSHYEPASASVLFNSSISDRTNWFSGISLMDSP